MLRSWSMGTVSRNSSRLCPSYQGVRSLLSTTLSPSRAESGKHVTSSMPRCLVSSRYSLRISLNVSSEKLTKSILLTASTICLIPRRLTRKVCRRVCVITPVRASTRIMARLAVDPPVIMLRVYCSCPGVSAIMNLR